MVYRGILGTVQDNEKENWRVLTNEEIYAMYGQYDAFVSLDFHIGSEAYNKYEKTLMGVFKYTLEQREELEKKNYDGNFQGYMKIEDKVKDKELIKNDN